MKDRSESWALPRTIVLELRNRDRKASICLLHSKLKEGRQSLWVPEVEPIFGQTQNLSNVTIRAI